jgi:hypothetical protein
MDYMLGLSLTNHGNDYIFLIVDWFYKMAILAPYKKSIMVETIVKIFFEHIWVNFEFLLL